MRLGIVGCRARDTEHDLMLVEHEYLRLALECDSIVSGGCPRGGDRFAEVIAKKWNVPIKIYPAEWNKHGMSAGYKRNIYIANDADVLIACVAKDRKGGTEDTIRKYLDQGKKRLILV